MAPVWRILEQAFDEDGPLVRASAAVTGRDEPQLRGPAVPCFGLSAEADDDRVTVSVLHTSGCVSNYRLDRKQAPDRLVELGRATEQIEADATSSHDPDICGNLDGASSPLLPCAGGAAPGAS